MRQCLTNVAWRTRPTRCSASITSGTWKTTPIAAVVMNSRLRNWPTLKIAPTCDGSIMPIKKPRRYGSATA